MKIILLGERKIIKALSCAPRVPPFLQVPRSPEVPRPPRVPRPFTSSRSFSVESVL